MIILRKNKKILELYPIGSSKNAVNQRRKPIFYGYLKIKATEDQIRPYKFIVKQDDKESLLPPGEAIKILRKQQVFLVGDDPETEEMLDSLNIKYRKTRICRHCTFEGYITLIKRDKSYLLHKEYICRLCAEEEIKRELKSRGFDSNSFKNFKKLLERTGNLEEVLKIFNPRFNPVSNPELTLFDRITTRDKLNLPEVKVRNLKIHPGFREILNKQAEKLLPVQILSIKAGILKGESQLVVAATASGKTLIGELAGIPRALNGRKFIYLTPLVALANQKYRDFKKRYEQLGLKVSIRVGMSRIKAKEELIIKDESFQDADIIVGTYEGLDFILRSGRSAELGEIGTVVIDEIHTLDNPERGSRLNGLIKRLEMLFPDVQMIGLSATVKNPREIAEEFQMKLVEYNQRPVPLDRHLVFVRSEYDKNDLMAKICRNEHRNISQKGFHGSTIIFTNSRRKTHEIASYLNQKKVKASAYHAGLSYSRKLQIENKFLNQEISTVVTTAALAAGVDFPASQVIFESLTMGNKWLTSNEFHQMLGRAGRPSYHDIGKVYLLPEVGRQFEDETEETVALDLLESDVETINVNYRGDELVEQFLADVCSGGIRRVNQLKDAYKNQDLPMEIDTALNIITDYKLVEDVEENLNETQGEDIKATPYGRAVSVSFLHHEDADYIRKNISRRNPLELVLNLQPLENAYLSARLSAHMSKVLKINISPRLFADSTLDILSSSDNLVKFDPAFQEKIVNIQMEFFTCKCKEKPFCTCFQAGLSRKILKYRLQKKDPVEISRRLLRDYDIHIYPGDIFTWLDSVIRMLEAMRRIAFAFNKKKLAGEFKQLIKEIEN
ncbi:MAG TPA: DEAD/DEAH box helicase [Methanobacterium sp.]|jgi:helicase|nr:DEAD/DEAH box helicase [Methanobacterium sp.]